MPAIIDVEASLGALLIGCFVAILCVSRPHLAPLPFQTRASVTQTLRICNLPGFHLLSAVPK